MSEAELHVPRLGRVAASPGFRLVAAMNPFDAVGTARISSAVYDRTCRLLVDYQSAADEAAIVEQSVGPGASALDERGWPRWSSSSGAPAATPRSAIGSSVRGAIDTAAVAASLAEAARPAGVHDPSVGLDAALSRCRGGCGCARASARTSEDDHHRALGDRSSAADRRVRPGKAGAPAGATASLSTLIEGGRGRRRGRRRGRPAHHVAPGAGPPPALRAGVARGRRSSTRRPSPSA